MAVRVDSAALRSRGAVLAAVRPWHVLTVLVVVQWVAVAALARTVRHNGSVWYQGGDQIWHYTSAWLLAHGQLPPTLVGDFWPVVLAPLALVAGPDLLHALPFVLAFQVLVLLPVALLAMYGIGERVAGRAFGYLTASLWVALPYFGIRYTLEGYHQKYTELTLPQSLGLTALSDFPSTVAIVVSAYFCLRALDSEAWTDGAIAGLAAGIAVAMKPANAIFLIAALLALALFRARALPVFVAALVPALVALALWKERGLGHLPVFNSGMPVRHLAAGATASVFGPVHHYVHLDWSHLNENRLGIREHFWSERLVDFSIVGGLVGLARKSWRAFVLVGVWFAAYVVLKGTYGGATVDSSSFFRLLMPAFPAFVVLVAALVFLVPGVRRARLSPIRGTPQRGVVWATAAAFAAFGIAPIAVVAAASPLRANGPDAVFFEGVPRPVDAGTRVTASAHGNRVHLQWTRSSTLGGTHVFYQVLVARGRGDLTCAASGGAAQCSLAGHAVHATRHTAIDDFRAPGRWTYRIATSANWLGDKRHGDVYTVSRPITVTVR